VHYPLRNQDGCREFEESDFNSNHLKEASFDGHKPIIMVDRGHCHFVTKVANIQKFGAVLAIIVDQHAQESTVMADDGTGGVVTIPSFLIGGKDGIAIKEAIHESTVDKIRDDQDDWDDSDGEAKKNKRKSRNWANIIADKSRSQYQKRGHQVIMQAVVGGKVASREKVDVELWYTSVYELFQSEWNLTRYSQMQDILKDGVKFQPRTLLRACQNCTEEVK
jgi:hypothetical protein